MIWFGLVWFGLVWFALLWFCKLKNKEWNKMRVVAVVVVPA